MLLNIDYIFIFYIFFYIAIFQMNSNMQKWTQISIIPQNESEYNLWNSKDCVLIVFWLIESNN